MDSKARNRYNQTQMLSSNTLWNQEFNDLCEQKAMYAHSSMFAGLSFFLIIIMLLLLFSSSTSSSVFAGGLIFCAGLVSATPFWFWRVGFVFFRAEHSLKSTQNWPNSIFLRLILFQNFMSKFTTRRRKKWETISTRQQIEYIHNYFSSSFLCRFEFFSSTLYWWHLLQSNTFFPLWTHLPNSNVSLVFWPTNQKKKTRQIKQNETERKKKCWQLLVFLLY